MGLVLTSCNICKKCKFYKALYTKEATRFKTITGYCFNENITWHNRKISVTMANCEFMEQYEDKTSGQRESIRKEITDMRKKLTQILEILENE